MTEFGINENVKERRQRIGRESKQNTWNLIQNPQDYLSKKYVKSSWGEEKKSLSSAKDRGIHLKQMSFNV